MVKRNRKQKDNERVKELLQGSAKKVKKEPNIYLQQRQEELKVRNSIKPNNDVYENTNDMDMSRSHYSVNYNSTLRAKSAFARTKLSYIQSDEFIEGELENIKMKQERAEKIKVLKLREKIESAKNKDKGIVKPTDEYIDRLREFIERQQEKKRKKKEFIPDPKTPYVKTFKELLEDYQFRKADKMETHNHSLQTIKKQDNEIKRKLQDKWTKAISQPKKVSDYQREEIKLRREQNQERQLNTELNLMRK